MMNRQMNIDRCYFFVTVQNPTGKVTKGD